MIKNCKYVGTISKKEVVKLIKEIQAIEILDYKPELSVFESGGNWWYHLYLHTHVLYGSVLKVFGKYHISMIHDREGFNLML